MWQTNGKKIGPINWAEIGPKNWLVWVPHGALPKFQKKCKKVGGGVATWQLSAQVWLVLLPLLLRRAAGRPFIHREFRPSPF